MKVFYSLYDRLLHRTALARAFEKVRRAAGAPGVDGQTISDFASRVEEEVDRLIHELRSKTYQPQPVRRVTIPKPGGGERNLGIPAVRDRVVQRKLDSTPTASQAIGTLEETCETSSPLAATRFSRRFSFHANGLVAKFELCSCSHGHALGVVLGVRAV